MKKIKFFAITFSVFMFSLSIANMANAQSDTIRYQGHLYARLASALPEADITDPYEPAFHSDAAMKESNINIRAVRDFKKRYKNVANETWLGTERGFAVRFADQAVSTTVRYTSSGRWIHTMKRYKEASLPKEIRAVIKPVYYDFTIVVVYEMIDNSVKEPVYIIHLKEGNTYKVVMVYNNELNETESFELQKPKD